MEISSLIPHIESLIFASDKPLTSIEITDLINQAFGFMEDKIVAEQVDTALEGIVEKYASEFYPFEVRMSGGGWQFLTKKEFHKTVAQLNGEKFLKRLSAAALETLAIIAYKQPITKGEIEAIRGVSTDYSIQKLLEKELILISGRNEKLPGHPLVYSTSKNFMDYFGINSPEDLPKIKEVLADQVVTPTVVNHTEFEQSETLAVATNGELIGEVDSDERQPNSHSLQQQEATGGDEEAENPADEAANEEFIADESFTAEERAEAESEIEDVDLDASLANNETELASHAPASEETPADEFPADTGDEDARIARQHPEEADTPEGQQNPEETNNNNDMGEEADPEEK
jgi:segregation and condensation protein B